MGTQEQKALGRPAPQGIARIPSYNSDGTFSLKDRKIPIEGKVIGPAVNPKFEELIRGFKYKPGYEAILVNKEEGLINGQSLYREPARFSVLYLKCYIPDSTKFPHDDTLVQVQFAIQPDMDRMPEHYHTYFLKQCLLSFEEHELDEWFRINGKLVNDPHGS